MKKKLFTLLTLLLCAITSGWALNGTEKATNTGTKDTDLKGTSYTIAGTYIAGAGGATATGMSNKGVKFRTGSDGARLVFTVNDGYTITDFKLYGVSNYALKSGASEPCIAVTKVEVDGTETDQTGTGNFPAKGSSTAGSVLLSGISATQSIAIYFDNSNADGTQINGYYEITWTAPDPEEPTGTTVSPTSGKILVGKTIQLTGAFASGNFEGEWVSDNESVATVSSTGLVTGVGEGTANITYQWVDDQSKDAFKATAAIKVYDLTFNKDALTAVKTYDFANWGTTTLTIESSKAGSIWNQANKKNNDVFRCTNEGLTSLAVQAVYSSKKGWTIDATGLLEGSGAGRCAAICDVKAGQYIEFNHTSGTSFYTKNEGEDDGVNKIPLVEESGHHVYYVEEDGMVGFEMAAGKYVTSVVIYEAKTGAATSLSFSAAKATATLGESFTAPTLTKDPADLAGVVFSSSNTAVATVDAETGEVTLKAGGITTITATFAETEEYWGAEASYELTVVDPNATGYNGEGATITWAFNTGATGQTATIDYNSVTEELFKSNNVSIGANLEYAGTQALKDSEGTEIGIVSTKIKQNNAGSATELKNAIKFTITPKTGITFTPTSVKFNATRCGTDGGKMEIAWIDSENSTIALESTTAAKNESNPARDNYTPNYTQYSYDLTSKGAKATTGECGLQIITYNANGKSYAFGQIVIEGTLSGSVSAVTTYTITAEVGTDGAGSVNPATVVVDEGEGTTLEATANTGYVFQNWTKASDNSTVTDNPLTVSNVTADETYTANFKKLYTVNYDVTEEGVLVGTCKTVLVTEYADANDKFTAPANLYTTKEGYTFSNWTDGTNSYVAGTEYTLTSDVTLAPVFTANTQSLSSDRAAATTVTWNFGPAYVFFNSQGNTQYYVQQTTINGEALDVPMFCDTQNGKLNNVGRTDNLAQANGGTILTIPAMNGMTIKATAYRQFSDTQFAGSTDYTASTASPWTADYTYTGDASTIDITIGSDIGWLSSIAVTYPATVTSITKEISAAGYATLCSEYPLDFSGSGVTAYIATVEGTAVTFSPVTSVPAETGVLLKGTQGTKTINIAASTTDVSDNKFVGVLENTEVPAGIFVLMSTPEFGVGFYKTNNAFTVGANTAYLPADVAGARSFIGFDDMTTAIEGIAAEQQQGEVYNLQGQRVVKAQKGLYIVDGKKVVLK